MGNQLVEFSIEMRSFQLTDGLEAFDAGICFWTSRSSEANEPLQLRVTQPIIESLVVSTHPVGKGS